MEVWDWQRESEDETVCRSLKQKDQQGGAETFHGSVSVLEESWFHLSYHLDLRGHPGVIARLILKDEMGSYEETELKSMAGLESELHSVGNF